MKRLLVSAALALAFAAPAAAQSPDASQAQDLSNCAGAVAAASGLDLAEHYPGRAAASYADRWGATLAAILARLSREEGMQGVTGLEAARAARSYWSEQPRAEQQAAAEACRDRFTPG